jgi:prevent-host-death family protein
MSDTLNSTDARKQLSDVLSRVAYGGDRVRIARRGKVVAAVVPIGDLEMIERLENEIDIREAEKSLREAKKKGTFPLDIIGEEIGL